MKTQSRWSFLGNAALLLLWTFIGTSNAIADEGDPSTRVARLAYVEGSASLQPAGTDDWVEAPLNRPLTTGDALWSDVNSRVELQLDGSRLRLASRTSVSFLNVDDQVTQVQLSSGTLIVRVQQLEQGETYEIDTPNLALSLLQPGVYRIAVDASGTVTTVGIRRGEGQVTGGGADFTVEAGQQVAFSGTDTLTANDQPYAQDPFDAWSAGRDAGWDHSVSAQYVSSDVVGYTDLDDQGDWSSTPDYGPVWFPRGVQAGWAPYHYGHWVYVAPWGYTWVDNQRWGFAPFHYGRWVFVRGAWGWLPAPPRPPGGRGYVRPVYAPALVAWVGGGAAVAWFALGPHEVYVPSYPVSRGYLNNINVSNTVVSRTVVNNLYNTTIVHNRIANTTNINYMNRGVPGAIAATTTQAFTSAQPVATHPVQFDPRAGRAQPFAPAAVPTRQAVVGFGRQGAGAPRPPAALQTRAVVARTAPPPPPPTFEQRQQAIQQNGGRPLSLTAVRRIQSQGAPRAAQVRLAPQGPGINRPGAAFNPRGNGGPAAVNRTPAVLPPQHDQDAGRRQLQQQTQQQARQQAQQQPDQQRQQADLQRRQADAQRQQQQQQAQEQRRNQEQQEVQRRQQQQPRPQQQAPKPQVIAPSPAPRHDDKTSKPEHPPNQNH